jgi:hypothetical protein
MSRNVRISALIYRFLIFVQGVEASSCAWWHQPILFCRNSVVRRRPSSATKLKKKNLLIFYLTLDESDVMNTRIANIEQFLV